MGLLRLGMFYTAATESQVLTQRQIDNCMACPFLYRLSESCSRNPDLFTSTPPDMITEDDLVFPMNKVGDPDFRTSILLESQTSDLFLLNLQLYAAWVFENVMVYTSVLTWLIPYACIASYFIFKKPVVCRVGIVVLYLKFISAFMTQQFEMGYSTIYRCGISGRVYEYCSLYEPIITLSGFFTYLALHASMNTNYIMTEPQSESLELRHYGFIAIGIFILLSYCSKMHLMEGNEASIMTSLEVGMVLSIILRVSMNILGLWPSTFIGYIEPSLNEEILLTHICVKWNIDNSLPRLQKLDAIIKTVSEALKAKKDFDKRAELLASVEQDDMEVYRELINCEEWRKMRVLVTEVVCLESKMCYLKLHDEIT